MRGPAKERTRSLVNYARPKKPRYPVTTTTSPKIIAAALLLSLAASAPGFAQTLRIAMTAADLPTTSGIPNNGGEGYRFLGFPAFDGLVDWDFTHPDGIAGLTQAWRPVGKSIPATIPVGSSRCATGSNSPTAPKSAPTP